MKRGPKPKGKISIVWSPALAYSVGLLVADGCLSKDGRHMSFTSKDKDLVVIFQGCLGLTTKISEKRSGNGSLAYHTQFGDVLFYDFLVNLGLSPRKSNIIGSVLVPGDYFPDFLRGYFDGDGSSYSYFDPVYPKSFRFYISFTSGSLRYLEWLRAELYKVAKIKGFMSFNRNNSYAQLKYSKKEAIVFCSKIYYDKTLPCLERKRLKVDKALENISR